MSASVAITRCNDYNYENVDSAIRRCIDLLGKDIIPRNKRVLLKPNLLSSTKGPREPINTHPVIVEVLARIVKEEYNCDVYIGDSSGGMSYGQTQRAFEITGLDSVAERLGVELVNFESTGVINLRNENNRIKKEFSVTRFIRDVDFIISLPKLKTHTLLGFTGSVKNMMGMVPGSGKRDMHLAAPKAYEMAQCIVDLYSLVKPNLSIMDAIIGMEGDGPSAGNPREIKLILASQDAVALDTIALEIIGCNSKELINDAHTRGLGISDIHNIEVFGEDLEDLKIKDFNKPVNRIRDYISSFLPAILLKVGYKGMTAGMPFINQVLCKRCNVCFDSCPVGAIEKISGGRLRIDYADCIECYCCHELCPHNAVEIRLPLSAKIWGQVSNLRRK